jgi:hypothetical protein
VKIGYEFGKNKRKNFQFNQNSKSTAQVKSKIDSLMAEKECDCDALVLVVEDNTYNVIPIRNRLNNNHGLKIQVATNGLKGFELFKKDL